jgi:hypothetical protein
MVQTVQTGRTPHELVEVAPTHYPAGHALGARPVLVGYGVRLDGARSRSWTCREYNAITWDEDDGPPSGAER